MLCVNIPTILFYSQRRKIFRVPNKIHQTTMDAVAYTISTGVNKWSAKIEITGWAHRSAHKNTTTGAHYINMAVVRHSRCVYAKMGPPAARPCPVTPV